MLHGGGGLHVRDGRGGTIRLPRVLGVIERRLLVNWSVDADVLARVLPPPFRPKLVRGRGVAGICLIRLARIRPAFVPEAIVGSECGLRSENAAHRVAVVWDEDGREREGVYVERRDTSSRLVTMTAGRIFPGVQHLADFRVEEEGDAISVELTSRDGAVDVAVAGRAAATVPSGSLFSTLGDASRFFEAGSLGWSVTPDAGRFHGLELASRGWKVEAFDVERARSNWIDDPARFPRGSAEFDCALLMRGIEHEWVAHDDLCCAAAV